MDGKRTKMVQGCVLDREWAYGAYMNSDEYLELQELY